ncbi:MAG: hypothetical protein KAT56_00010, partial [Sedimentisphaerales bacterium]|nr:hypothetical protein [Sedimentisphaerales bacterium]
LPAIASWSGAKVTEIEVTHHPRRRGKSKYGLNRTMKVLLDLVTVKFLGSFSTRPLHIFGGIGLLAMLLSFILGVIMFYQKYAGAGDGDMTDSPLLLMSAMLLMMSVQFLLMGLLAEMMCRTYHESQSKSTYIVRRIYEPGVKKNSPSTSEEGSDNGEA